MRPPIAAARRWTLLPVSQARSQFLGHTAGGFLLKVAVTGLFFVTSVALARLLGVEGYGAYTYALTWSGLLSLLASLGLGQLVTRSMAAYQAQADWGRVKGLLIWSHGSTLAASAALALIGALAAWLGRGALDRATLLALALALFLLPLTTLMRLQQSALRGFGHVILSQLPESLIQPLLLLVIVGGLWLGLPGGMSAPWAMAANVAATLGALGIAALLVVRRSPPIPAGTTTVYAGRAWLRSALPLLSISALVMVNSRAVILLLGAMAGVESVALYNVAARGAEVLSFVLVPTELALQPRIARLYALGDRAALQGIVRQGARVMA
ncbi:MAG: oligosaccharide flippase family protein, partial [Caldilineaceae bacterium]|nr:oligosaccharide flippase family protein [Caldilineaceae bacterium]